MLQTHAYLARLDHSNSSQGALFARFGMRAIVALCWAVSLPSLASELTLVSTTEAKPGEVLARLSYQGDTPPSSKELGLRLDANHLIPADSVTPISPGKGPAALVICIDASGSMGPEAVATIQRTLRDLVIPQQGKTVLPYSVAIVEFGTTIRNVLGLSNQASQVEAALAQLGVDRSRHGKTRLHDAVASGLAQLRASDASVRHLLVVSDGQDEGSDINRAMIIAQATASPSVPIDAVGFGNLAPASSESLSTLAGATGGRFTPAPTPADLQTTLGRLVRLNTTSTQIDIRFRYAGAPDGPKVSQPALEYAHGGDKRVSIPIDRALAGIAATPVPAQSTTPSAAVWALLSKLSPAIWAGIGIFLALLIALLFMLLRRRDAEEDKEPVPPPVYPESEPTDRTGAYTSPPPPPAPRKQTAIAFNWPDPGGERAIAVLHIMSGPLTGRRHEIRTGSTRIGGTAENDLILPQDDFVSGQHAVIRAENMRLYIVDLASRNGIDLNGTRFNDGTRSLRPGDQLTIGRTLLGVGLAEPSSASQPAFEQRVR